MFFLVGAPNKRSQTRVQAGMSLSSPGAPPSGRPPNISKPIRHAPRAGYGTRAAAVLLANKNPAGRGRPKDKNNGTRRNLCQLAKSPVHTNFNPATDPLYPLALTQLRPCASSPQPPNPAPAAGRARRVPQDWHISYKQVP